MTLVLRRAFAGWQPDADAVNGPPGALLRADNLTLDERGVLGLRLGSAPIGPALADLDVHSLFTGVINGARYRMTGAGNTVYANGAAIVSNVTGSGDIAFGSAFGQLLTARGTTTQKYDGATVRNWGIAMTAAAPQVGGGPLDGKTLATGAQSESPAFTIDEDDGTGLSYATGADGTANGAIILHPNATTGRGTLSKRFTSAVDATAYDNGTPASDNDLLTFWVYITEPSAALNVTVMVDVNPASTNPYQDDYYTHQFQPTDLVPLGPTTDSSLPIDLNLQGSQRHRVAGGLSPAAQPSAGLSQVKPVTNAGWNKLSIRRGDMTRIGSTTGCDWTTVIGVRFSVITTTATPLRFQKLRLVTNPITGAYKWAIVYVYDSGTYQALSAPSPLSLSVQLSGQSALIDTGMDLTRDPQVTDIWAYRMGGTLDAFYRTATAAMPTGFSYTATADADYVSTLSLPYGQANFTYSDEAAFVTVPVGPKSITSSVDLTGNVRLVDELSDIDALALDLPLETDDTTPPANIVAIEGPYYDRIFALTSDGLLWPSRKLNPDSFATGQAIRVAGSDETPYWVKQALGGLYIGTSKDVYRLDGTGAELPDGTIDFIKTPMNIDHAPINTGVAKDGNLLIYMAEDGWRAFTGAQTQLLVGDTSLLYRGYTRYGLGPVNTTSGRFRAVISKGQLLCLTPLGSDTTSTTTLLRHVPTRETWYRSVYAQGFRSLYREPDGTILAGDTAGLVWQLDTGISDNGSAIPMTLWTKADDLDDPIRSKQPDDCSLQLDTGGATVATAFHLDTSDTPSLVSAATQNGVGLATLDIAALAPMRQVQLRLTGACTTFKLLTIGWTAVPLAIATRVWDSGPIDLAGPELSWLRWVRVKAQTAAPVTVTVYYDGALVTSDTVAPTTSGPTVTLVGLPRDCKGYVPRVVVTSPQPFFPFWIELRSRGTGAATDKTIVRIPAETAA